MASNKSFFFFFFRSLSTSSSKALTNIDDSKKLNHWLKIARLKIFVYYKMFFKKCFFFSSKIYFKVIFYITQGNFLYYITQLKILILPTLLLKWNKTCCIEFFLVKILVSFVKLLNINLEKYSLFLSHVI